MSITAVVLTSGNYDREWPGIEVVVHTSKITNAAEQRDARFKAAMLVKTSHWFWLDDDDDLPTDYLDVLRECVSTGQPLAYTDEIVRSLTLGESRTFAGNYTREEHINNPTKVHHLALYQTNAALDAMASIPCGHYWPEMLLSWVVARKGAAYVPRVGYIWNKKEGAGMHSWPATQCGVMRSLLWCKENP